MLSVRQVAERLEISPDRVRGLIHGRRLRAHNFGPKIAGKPRYAIDVRDLERFLEESIVNGKIIRPPRGNPNVVGRIGPAGKTTDQNMDEMPIMRALLAKRKASAAREPQRLRAGAA